MNSEGSVSDPGEGALRHRHRIAWPLAVIAALAWVAPAANARDDDLSWAEYYLSTGQNKRAARIAADALEKDPTDLEAHELYIIAWLGMGERDVLEIQYRAWHEQDPDDEVRRLALAQVVRFAPTQRYDPEFDELLLPLPDDPACRLSALELFHDSWWRPGSPGDPADAVASMEELGRDYEPAAVEAALLSVIHHPVDDELASVLEDYLDRGLIELDDAGWLWHRDAGGPALARVQERVLERARAAIDGDDPRQTLTAKWLLSRAHDLDAAERAWQRTLELDPDTVVDPYTPLQQRIHESTKRLDPAVALRDLHALEDEVPEQGELRADFEHARAGVLLTLGRKRSALRARRVAYDADPEDLGNAIYFAMLARTLEQDQQLAIDALEQALAHAALQPYALDDFRRIRGYAQWHEGQQERYCRALTLEAELLVQLDRRDEAAEAWLRSLLILDDPVIHLRLGMLYKGQGELDLAFEHLALGLARAPTERPDLDSEARVALDALYPYRPYWNAGSLDAYLDARALGLEHDDGEDQRREQEVAELVSSQDRGHPLQGKRFPDLPFDEDGTERSLYDYEGILVVELWNTW